MFTTVLAGSSLPEEFDIPGAGEIASPVVQRIGPVFLALVLGVEVPPGSDCLAPCVRDLQDFREQVSADLVVQVDNGLVWDWLCWLIGVFGSSR